MMGLVNWIRRIRPRIVAIPEIAELRAKLFPPDRQQIPGQVEFLRLFDQEVTKYVAYRAGIGAGKTWIGAHYALECAARNPKVRGFIAANTYPQLFQSTLSCLYEVAESYGVPIYPKTPEAAAKKKMLKLWNQVEVICRSAENVELWDGFKVGWWWLDEPKDMKQAAYRTICERHRDNRVDKLQGWMTASPSGHNWFGELDTDPDVSVITASTRDNPFLPSNYIDTLLSKMTPEMVEQQIEGKVLNTQMGECYSGFLRAENVMSLTRGDGEMFIGIDFNVEPGMHAYLIEIRGADVLVHEEIYLRGGDTPSLGRELLKRYGNQIPLVPDAAGGQRHTTGTSDHAILRGLGFKLKNRPANPPIKDRINSVSAKILNAKNERHLFIDPSCKLLINDLERCTWEVMRKDSYRGPLTHPGAAIGYTVHLKFPFAASGFGMSLGNFRK
jgi:Terminase large subunit, T4likevirus-type, N-terminal